jgi:glycosyltransferase involved in cell wall biosynthesis
MLDIVPEANQPRAVRHPSFERPMLSLSVVMPCFNGAEYLADAIASVRAQTRPVREILVVDDGSTDGSAELATRLGARVLRTAGREGPAAARNLGIREASGDVIGFLDADDLWEADHCAGLLELLERYPDAVLAFARATTFGAHEKEMGRPVPDETARPMLHTLLARNFIVQSAVIVRRSALLAAGGYRSDLRHAEDYDLWLRLAREHPFVGRNRFSARYRVHGTQASRNEAALSGGACEARWRIWLAEEPGASPEERATLRRLLLEAWERSLVIAWKVRDSGTIRSVLALHTMVPGSDAAYRRWRWRVALLRPPWRAAAGLWDALGPSVRRRLAPFKRVVPGPAKVPKAGDGRR